MRLRLSLRLSARADIREAAQWYEAQRSGLGSEFLVEVDHILGRIRESPSQFPEIELEVRRGLLRRFPYAVYFLAKTDHIEVIAVLHLHRDPDTWKRRK